MKQHYLLSALSFFLFISNISAQLSDIHYLPPLKQVSNNAAIQQQAFYLSTPETTAFDVLVYIGTNPIPVVVAGVSNATPQLYDIPDGDNDISLVTDTNTGIVLSNSGLRFESAGGQEFYVNYRGRSTAQAASLTSKGRKALGTLFKWGGIPNRASNENLTTSLGIMATENGTTIDIYGYDTGCEFRLQGDPDGLTDDTMQITLNAGQTFVLEALKNETTANIDGWLGATIRSDKKIAISNGGLNTGVDSGSPSRDTGIDQPVPENVLGKEYVFVRGNGTSQTEFPVIIATRNDTEIFVNGSGTPIATIDTGEYFEIPSSNYSIASPGGNMYVETSEVAYAYQSLAGAAIIRTVGMNFIASVNCLLPDQVNNIPNIQNIDGLDFDGGVTIIASTATPDANIIVTDNSGVVTLPASSPVAGTSDWKTFYVNGLMGDVSVISTGPVTVGMFGANNNAGVAGYYSGFDTVPTVELDLGASDCFPGTIITEVTGSFDAYQWFQDDMILPGETTNSYTPITQGDFFVRVSKGSCTYDSAIVSVYACAPEIVLTKTVDTSPVLEGDTVTFTITVEHLGIDPVTNLVINEALPSELTLVSATPSFGSWSAPDWTIGNMYSGELHTLTVVATVNELDAATTVTNTITNTQNEVDGNTITDDPTEDVAIIHSELSLSKRDRDALDGSYDTVGEIIIYDLVVTNTGDTDLTNVTITDPNIDPGSLLPATVPNLASGDLAVFTARHTITQEDLEADQVVNSATAQGTLSNGFVISDLSDDPNDPATTTDDPTITPLDQEGALVLEKVALPAPDGLYDALGEIIEYQLTVTNTGNVSLDNVTITDPNADVGSISPVTIPKLEVGETAIFTALHTIVPADFTAGNVINTATVSGTEPVEGELITDDSDNPITATLNDPTVITIPQFARLEFTKEASLPSDGSYDTVGESIFYTLVVSSTGTVDVTNVNVVDPNADNIILQSTTGTDDGVDNIVDNLAPGEVASFIASHVLTQEDLDSGQVTNSAIVGGLDPALPIPGGVTDVSDDLIDPSPNDDDATIVALASEPMLSLTKEADDNTNVIEGQVVTYSYRVENTGNVTIDNVSVSDVHNADGTLGTITLISTTGTDNGTDAIVDVLSPGETATYQAMYTITATDVANQTDITNTATATGTPRTSSITDPTANEIVTIAPVETICSGATLGHDLTTDVIISGASFTWFATDNPNITGETTIVSTSTSITDTLINISTTDQIVNYTVMVTDGVGFPQDSYTYQVTVQAVPVVAVAPTETICSNDALNHDLTADVNLGGVTFSWVAADNVNVTGETTTASTDTSITDTLINTSASVQTVVYTITPTAADGCSGNSYTYEVLIEPEPVVAVSPTLTICSDVALAHDLTADVSLAGSTFSWSAVDNPNIDGETTATSTATSITDVLTNESGSVQTVIYTITPTSANGCVGDAYTYTVTIDPESFVATAPTDTVCSNIALTHDLNGDVNIVGSTFSWLATNNPNVTGETITASTATSITDILTNTSGSVQTVIYTITPTSPDGCIGDPYVYTVTIDPEPFVTTVPTDTVCSDVALAHDLNGDMNLTGVTFSWSAATNPNITGETTVASTTTSITDILTNTSGSVQTVVYTITPTSADGCIGDIYTYTVTVTPESFVATAPTDTVCSDVALSHDLNADVNIAGSTFSWSAADNPNITGETTVVSTATSITDVLTNESGSVQTVLYTIIPTSPDGCIGDAYTYTVTIDPEPFVVTAPTDTVCSDVVLSHDLNGDVNLTGATFSWSAATNPNVTGETTVASTATSITDVLTNESGSVQTVIYTITPTSSDGCIGDIYTYTVTIDAAPFVATAPTDTVCSDIALAHDLNGDVNLTGVTFSWSAATNPNVTGETTVASTATSITDVLTNESGSVQTVLYTITPMSSDGCVGDTYTYTVTVTPESFVATAPIDTVCSDVALSHDLNGDVNIAGSTFSWSAATNPNITGETTSVSTATSITDVLTNESGSVQTVVYTITPTSPDGCIGDPYTYTVTVDPEPFVAILPTDVVCSDVALAHNLNGDVNLTGVTFSWSAIDNPNVTGETTVASTVTSITDVLTNESGSVQTVVYTIIPTSADGCVGDVYTYTVTIDAAPFVATAPTDTVCSDVALAHDLNDDVDLTGVTFSWSAADNPNIDGETTVVNTTTNITDVLTNESGSVQTVIYTIMPTSSDGCVGDPYTYTVTVNPAPFVALAPTDTVCSDVALAHNLNGDVNIVGSTFSWSAATNPNVTGETTVVSTATSITDVLTNESGSVQTVIYTITPTSADGCVGDVYTYTVTIDAAPFVATAPTDTVCSDVGLSHDLNNDVNVIGATFSWSAIDNPNVTGETTVASTATSITDVLTNESGNVQTVIYTITPTSADGCVGDMYMYTVTVDPAPFVATAPTDTVCSDVTLNHDLNGDVNITGATFSWSAIANPNVTGETTVVSTSTSITDVLINESGSVQTIIYTITPTSSDGCIGDPYTYTVTVDPAPFVTIAPISTICSTEQLNLDLATTTNLAGATFSWVASDNPNVTGETVGTSTGNVIADTLINTSTTTQTVVYAILPVSSNGCIGNVYTYTVTINPSPIVAIAPTATVCSDETLNHSLNDDVNNVTGVTFSWSAAANPNVTGETTTVNTTATITDTLINTSGSVQTIVYTITPTTGGSCIGSTYTYEVTVNPEPIVVTLPIATVTVCSAMALNHDLNNDVNTIGTTFRWSAAANPNITGETTVESTTATITDTLINTSGSVQTIVYTITPTSADGCVGDPYMYTISVNPEPFVAIAPTETICSTDTLAHDLNADVNLSGVTFSWVAIDNLNVTGETTTTSTNTSITDTLINTGITTQEVIYMITPTSPDGCVGTPFEYTVTLLPQSELQVTKTVLPAVDGSYDTLGEEVIYEIQITNRTESTINTLTITDNNGDMITMPTLPVLESNASVMVNVIHIITQEDLDLGTITNQVNVRGVDFCNNIISQDSDDPTTLIVDDATVLIVDQKASLTLLKTADAVADGLLDAVGEVIVYTLEVVNTGNVTLTDVTISDAHVDVGSIIPATISTLTPGQQVLFQASYTITQEDINNGYVINTASVAAMQPNGMRIEDLSDDPNDLTDIDLNGDGNPDDPTIVITPQFASLSVVKSVDKATYSAIDEVLTYTIEITNTGNITVFNVSIEDPLIDFGVASTLPQLVPNESITLVGEYQITGRDIVNQQVDNIAVVTAEFSNGAIAVEEDSDDPLDLTNIDDDNDGDAEDPTRSYLDTDSDMIIDIDDLDWDNDGITNAEEQNGDPTLDTDADGIIDSLDPDADGDGIFDYIEAGHGVVDANVSGALEGAVGSDGIIDNLQDLIDDGTVNYEPQDTDGDGIDDFQDIDDDDDRIVTSDENPDPNGNGIPEDAQDSNGNGIPNYLEPNNSNRVRIDGVEVFTGMSPNGDGVNDVFVITNENENEATDTTTLEVFNRWGVRVYTSSNYGENDEFFRGISEGRVTFREGEELPVGTYYYVYVYTNDAGERKTTSGYMYINR